MGVKDNVEGKATTATTKKRKHKHSDFSKHRPETDKCHINHYGGSAVPNAGGGMVAEELSESLRDVGKQRKKLNSLLKQQDM